MHLHDESSAEIREKGTYLNIMKAIVCKPIANIKLNGEKLKTFPLKSGTRQDCTISPYLLNIVLEILSRVRRHLNDATNWIQGIQIRKEEAKLLLFAEDMIVKTFNIPTEIC